MNRANRFGRVFLFLVGAVVLYMAISLVAGWEDIHETLSRFPLRIVPLLVGLSFLNYGLRFWRWELYRRRVGVPIGCGESLALFLATFAMVVTPGKLGEVYKAGYLWERHRVPLATGLPILVAERVLDFLAILFLAAAGLAVWRSPLAGLRPSLAVAAVIFVLLLLLRSRRLQEQLLARITRIPWVRARKVSLEAALDEMQRLSSTGLTLAALLLSVTAWAAECLSLHLVCAGLGASLPLLVAVFAYAVGTLAGSLVFLPGGLGGTEGTIIFLLGSAGLPTKVAVAATLIVRMATLWFAVAIGIAVFLGARRLFLAPPSTATVPGDG